MISRLCIKPKKTTYKEEYKKMALSYNTKMLNLKKKISEDKKNLRSIILDQDRDLKYQKSVIDCKNQEVIDLETMLKDANEFKTMLKMVFFVVGLISGVVLGCLL